ncbi:MAG: ABC transporter ATP-binding protein/permease [Candidatus Pacebacteria bacterium]|nr:ABC transporter ATP-binding protein/permease [Candidatus Paceibacterota bacterium]
MKKTITVLSFMWQELKKYTWYIIATFVLYGIFVAIGDALVPLYIKRVTNALEAASYNNAFIAVGWLIGLYVIQRVCLFVSIRILSYFESLTSRDLNTRSMKSFLSHSYNFYTQRFTGSLVEKSKRIGNSVIAVVDILLFNFFGLIISIGSILTLLFIENVSLGFTFVGFLILYVLIVRWMGKKMSPIYEDRSAAKTKFNAVISDIFTNIQTVLAFGSRDREIEKFENSNENFHQKRYRAWKMAVNYQDGIGFLPPLFTGMVTLYAIYLASVGSLSVGSVVLVFILGNNFSNQIWRINRSVKDFVSHISDCVEAIELIEHPQEITDEDSARSNFVPKSGEVVMNNISFTYPDGDAVFKNFNLHIPDKQSVGIVGKSGSGKTTITKLLLRLYDTNKGSILYGDTNIKELKQKELKQAIAYVPQDTILFHRTIYENIAYGNPDASNDEVYAAAEAAHVDEFVKEFTDGYQTMVGERGIKLSGGQRQRIGIARAMLKKDAPLLIMDEATSSLDTLSEQYIQDSFEDLSENRTTIVIAHRLSTIQKMDRIIVLENGKIVEDGNHFELLEKNGYYAELWNSQKSELIIT